MNKGSESCSCVSAMPGAEEETAAAAGDEAAAAELPDVDARGRKSGMSNSDEPKLGWIALFCTLALIVLFAGAMWLGLPL